VVESEAEREQKEKERIDEENKNKETINKIENQQTVITNAKEKDNKDNKDNSKKEDAKDSKTKDQKDKKQPVVDDEPRELTKEEENELVIKKYKVDTALKAETVLTKHYNVNHNEQVSVGFTLNNNEW